MLGRRTGWSSADEAGKMYDKVDVGGILTNFIKITTLSVYSEGNNGLGDIIVLSKPRNIYLLTVYGFKLVTVLSSFCLGTNDQG